MAVDNKYSEKAALFGNSAIGVSYLVANEIPNFRFNGSYAFSLFISFGFYTLKDSYLFCDESGNFKVEFKESNLAIFFCGESYTVPSDALDLLTSVWYTMSISFDNTNLSVYIDGILCSKFQVEKISSEVLTSDKYKIGYNWDGFMKSIILVDHCLADSEIASLYYTSNFDDFATIAWFDFTGERIEDRSKNNIPIYQGQGGMVDISNVCKVVDLSSSGFIKSSTSMSDDNREYSSICNVYLLENYGEEPYTLISNNFGESRIELSFIKSTSSPRVFQLACSCYIEDHKYDLVSKVSIQARNWINVGIVFSNHKLSLHIDGIYDNSIDNLPIWSLAGSGEVIIGAKIIDNDNISQCLNGYLSYSCEFNKALDETQLIEYTQNPPYIFSHSLSSLFLFSTDVKKDYIQYAEYSIGQNAKLAWIPDTQQYFTPTTFDVEVSSVDCKEWNDYTENEQWEIEVFATVFEGYAGTMGAIDINSVENWYQDKIIANQINGFVKNDPSFSRFLESGSNITQKSITTLLKHSTIPINGISAATSLLASASAVSVAAATSELLSQLSIVFLTGVGAAILVKSAELIIDAVQESMSKRPDPDDPDDAIVVTIEKVKTIVSDDLSESAIDVTKDGLKSIISDNIQDVACYVLSKVENPYIVITVTCTINTQPEVRYTLYGTEIKGSVFGIIESEPFNISLGETKSIKVKLDVSKIKMDNKSVLNSNSTFYWEIRGGDKNVFIKNTVCDFYSVYDIPTTPWTKMDNGCLLPWTNILNVAACWINQTVDSVLSKDELLKRLTVALNESGAIMNLDTGSPSSIRCSNNSNDLLTFNIANFKNITDQTLSVCNMECTMLLASLARLHGVNLNMVTMGAQFCQGFSINMVQPIGYSSWEKMFPAANDGDGFLRYHTFATDCVSSVNFSDLKVYDASVKLKNQSSNPQIPIKMNYASQMPQLCVTDEDAPTYRGMLVKKGEILTISIPFIDNWYIEVVN